ncbi:hypothetical protein A5761_21860 [Mycolicibacterium setense]|uniref:VOC family protein n=1 Tax=Mycolicibacterium setense TaxID=431269 RepID=UPI0007EBCDFE|nr:VOC family protein [Mycolicibacterium setense]OBB12404.1 hypothetical protein A5761_21860 [Mycolicibacterium setense]
MHSGTDQRLPSLPVKTSVRWDARSEFREAWEKRCQTAGLGSRSGPFPRLTFQRVPEPKATKVRIHLDVQVDDIDEGVVVVMLDPEEHEFCLVQYFEDHASEVDQESVRR